MDNWQLRNELITHYRQQPYKNHIDYIRMEIEILEDILSRLEEPIIYGRIREDDKVMCIYRGSEDELLDMLIVLIDTLGVDNQINLETFLRINRN
jgi:hypothetical protein